MNRTRTGLLLAASTAVISGVAIPFNGYGVRAVGDATLYTTLKNVVAGALLGILALAVATTRRRAATSADTSVSGSTTGARGKPADAQVSGTTPRAAWRGVALAVVGGSVPFLLFFEGLSQATSADAAFLHKTLVVWVALLAVPLLGEKVGVRHVAAIGLLLAGQLTLVGHLPAISLGSGELLILTATGLWSVEVILAKRYLADVASHTAASWRMTGGAVLLVAWALIQGVSVTAVPAGAWVWILVSGALLTGYVATWYAALSRAPAVDVTAILVLGAVVSAAIDVGRGLDTLAAVAPGALLLLAGATVLVAGRRGAAAASPAGA